MPTFADTVAGDYQITDDLQTIQYTSVVTTGGGNKSFPITSADGHDLSARELALLGGLFQPGDTTWFLGADQFAAQGVEPRQGDLLTDAAGTHWTVTGLCSLDSFGISWEVGCTKAR